jgi:type IV fimbrial biogenesis protein FimT
MNGTLRRTNVRAEYVVKADNCSKFSCKTKHKFTLLLYEFMKLLASLIKSQRRQRQGGFTLIEIVVVVAILGILIAIAMPSFTSTIRRFRADAIRDDLMASLQIARSESIRVGLPITIARTPNAGTCAAANAGDWSCGWQIFQDINNNNVFDAATEILIQESTVRPGFSVTETSTAPVNFAIANRWGQFSTTQIFVTAPIISGTTTASDPSANAVCLGAGGRVIQTKQSSGNVTCTP